MQDFHFTSKVSKATPLLMLHCANGKHINEGTITVRKAGNQDRAGVEFLFYKFETITITSVQEAGDTNDIPVDSVSIAFQKIDVMYKPQTPAGGVGSAVEFAWDLKANNKI
jgi:type VI secretion system secreted protein Hcp